MELGAQLLDDKPGVNGYAVLSAAASGAVSGGLGGGSKALSVGINGLLGAGDGLAFFSCSLLGFRRTSA